MNVKKFAFVLTIIYFIAISSSIVYPSLSTEIISIVKSENIEKLKYQLQINKDKELVRTSLFYAIDNQKVNAVKILIDHVDNIDYEATFGRLGTLLDAAISVGNMEIVNMLIDKGANINKVDSMKVTPLQKAIAVRNYTLACELVDRGADLTKGEYKFEGVSDVWEKEDKEKAERLVRIAVENTDVNKSENIIGFYQMAVYIKNYELLDVLIEKYHEQSYLEKALKTAVIGKDIEMMDYIIGKGGNVNSEEIYSLSSWLSNTENFDMLKHLIIRYGYIDNKIASQVFMRALWSDDIDAARFLLENGLDVKELPVEGHSPILVAINKCKPEVVKLLLEYNVPIEVKRDDGKDVFEVLSEIREKNVDWFDFENKKNMDSIYNMLKEYSENSYNFV